MMPASNAPVLGPNGRPCLIGGAPRTFDANGACADVCDDTPPVPRSCCRGCPRQGWEIPQFGQVVSVAPMDVDITTENLGGRTDVFQEEPLVWQGSVTSTEPISPSCQASHQGRRRLDSPPTPGDGHFLEQNPAGGIGSELFFLANFGITTRAGLPTLPALEANRVLGNYTGQPATSVYMLRVAFRSDPYETPGNRGNWLPLTVQSSGDVGHLGGGAGYSAVYVPCTGLWAISIGSNTVEEQLAQLSGLPASYFSASLSGSVTPIVESGSTIGLTVNFACSASYVGPSNAVWDGWSAQESGSVTVKDERFGNCDPVTGQADCGCGCGGNCGGA